MAHLRLSKYLCDIVQLGLYIRTIKQLSGRRNILFLLYNIKSYINASKFANRCLSITSVSTGRIPTEIQSCI